MVRLLTCLPLVAPIMVSLFARVIADRVDPRYATWQLTGVATVLAAGTCASLGLLAFGGVLRVPVVAQLGHYAPDTLRRDPNGLTVAAVATLLLLAALGNGVRVVRRRWRTMRAAAAQARRLPGGQVVVLDDPVPEAFALPGAALPWPRSPEERRGRVVVSSGMLEALDEHERQALVAHERAHLRCGHHLFVAVVSCAAAINPLLRPVVGAVTYSIERWADENAAARTRDRSRTASAIGRAALARGTASTVPLGALSAAVGPVPRRVAALLAPPPRPYHPLVMIVVVAVVVTSLSALLVAAQLHHSIELAQHITAVTGVHVPDGLG